MLSIPQNTTPSKTQSSENTLNIEKKSINNVVNLPYTSSELRDLAKFYIVKDISLSSRLSLIAEQVAYYEDNPDKPFKTYEWLTPNQHSEVKRGVGHPSIHPEDYSRLVSLGIDPEVILLSVESTCDPKQTRRYLGYPLVATGYVLHSVNPVTGFTDPDKVIVFRPSKSIADYPNRKLDNGYYVSQCKGDIKGLLFFNTGKPGYYQENILSNSPFNITKDIDLALFLLSNLPEKPTVALPCQWSEALSLITLQKELTTEGRLFNLLISVEDTKNDAEHNALLKFSKNIVDAGGEVRIVVCEHTLEDMVMSCDDKNEVLEKYRELLEKAFTLEEYVSWRNDPYRVEKQALESQLTSYVGETDYITKVLKQEKLQRAYPSLRNKSNFDALVTKLKRQLECGSSDNEDDVFKIVSAMDFIDDESIGLIEYLIDKFIAVGNVSILSGYTGEGKSTFAYCLAKAVAIGQGEFATRKVLSKQKVLFIQSDEPEPLMKERMINIDLYVPGLDILPKSRGWSYDNGGLDWLEKAIKANGYGLLVIDNLDAVKPGIVKELSDGNAGKEIINPLVALAEKYNFSALVLNHTTKGNRSQSAGSWTLLASVYSDMVIARDKKDSNIVTLTELKTRMHSPKTIKYKREGDNLYDFIDITDNNSTVATEKTLKEQVREALAEIAERYQRRKEDSSNFTVKDLAERLGEDKDSTQVGNEVTKLKKQGYVEHKGKGIWTITEKGVGEL